MRKIFKYPLSVNDHQEIHVPACGEFISVQVQNDVMCLWALVDEDKVEEAREIRVIGTGHPIYDDSGKLDYIDTVQMMNGELIWHIFEDKE